MGCLTGWFSLPCVESSGHGWTLSLSLSCAWAFPVRAVRLPEAVVAHCLEQGRALIAVHGSIPNRNHLQWMPSGLEEVAAGTKELLRSASTLNMGP